MAAGQKETAVQNGLPLLDTVYSPKTDQLQELANILVENYQNVGFVKRNRLRIRSPEKNTP